MRPKQKIKKMKSNANFKNSISTLTREMKGTCPNSHPKPHQKSKANPNPIQSQSKAKANPIYSTYSVAGSEEISVVCGRKILFSPLLLSRRICKCWFSASQGAYTILVCWLQVLLVSRGMSAPPKIDFFEPRIRH